jgi:hypothetical protein
MAYGGDSEDDLPTRLYSPAPYRLRRHSYDAAERAPAPHRVPIRRSLSEAGPVSASSTRRHRDRGGRGRRILLTGARSITVTVTGPGGRALDGVKVLSTGGSLRQLALSDLGHEGGGALSSGPAKGYQDTADQAVSIDSSQNTHNIHDPGRRGTA